MQDSDREYDPRVAYYSRYIPIPIPSLNSHPTRIIQQDPVPSTMSRAQTIMILRVRFIKTHPDDELTQNVNTSSLTNDSKSFPQLHAHDRATIQAHDRATIPVHCSEQPACTVNDLSRCIASNSMHAQRTIASSRMHNDRAECRRSDLHACIEYDA